MPDYLGRESSPLSPAQWRALDTAATEAARRTLAGRRLIPLYGPIGPGFEVTQSDRVPRGAGTVNVLGEGAEPLSPERQRRYVSLPVVSQDFVIHWRDLEASARLGLPLDTSLAAAAAVACARAEDELIFNGSAALEQAGLRTVPGRVVVPQSDWSRMGGAFHDVVSAVDELLGRGLNGPFALAASPDLYMAMNRMFENSGVLEIDQVAKLLRGGVFTSAVLPRGAAVLVATGPENVDLAVGVDMCVAYTETSQMNHHFRVLETVALRIKRPDAICTIEPAGQPASARGASRA
ncbi:MAG: family 1 encapsulin nanocompartment shell protein [Chloroflexota bacterium]